MPARVFLVEKSWGSAQGRPKVLPTYLECVLPSDKKFGSWPQQHSAKTPPKHENTPKTQNAKTFPFFLAREKYFRRTWK